MASIYKKLLVFLASCTLVCTPVMASDGPDADKPSTAEVVLAFFDWVEPVVTEEAKGVIGDVRATVADVRATVADAKSIAEICNSDDTSKSGESSMEVARDVATHFEGAASSAAKVTGDALEIVKMLNSDDASSGESSTEVIRDTTAHLEGAAVGAARVTDNVLQIMDKLDSGDTSESGESSAEIMRDAAAHADSAAGKLERMVNMFRDVVTSQPEFSKGKKENTQISARKVLFGGFGVLAGIYMLKKSIDAVYNGCSEWLDKYREQRAQEKDNSFRKAFGAGARHGGIKVLGGLAVIFAMGAGGLYATAPAQ